MRFLLLFFLLVNYVYGQNPIVETSVGTIEGLPATDGDYTMILGIPFARVNASNPFGEAIPNPIFNETFQAFDDTAKCPQREEFNNTITGSLDCLHLHIHVPNSAYNSTASLPVLVYIFGGRFEIGFAGRFLYGPKFLVRHDVIFITFNYRLGPYGFMCLNLLEVPGNQGLKDQILALRWIKDNISAFGGDPEKVTIFGESAGAMSVDYHLYSSNTENLFKGVIMQSGQAIKYDLITDADQNAPIILANYLGIQVNDVYEAITALSTVDAHIIIEAEENTNVQFGPCVEQVFEDLEPFLTDYPLNLDLNKVQNRPVLLGFNSHELALYSTFPLENFEDPSHFENLVQAMFYLDDVQQNKLTELLKRFYIGNAYDAYNKMWGVADFISDMNFNYGAVRSLRKYIENGAEKVYTYVFAYNGDRNFLKQKLNFTVGGANHADDLGYLFDISYMGTPSERDQLMIDRMTAMWTNFAKYDDPTPELTDILPVKWEPVVNGSPYYYMDLDSSLNLWTSPLHERIAFLDLVFSAYKEYEKGRTD